MIRQIGLKIRTLTKGIRNRFPRTNAIFFCRNGFGQYDTVAGLLVSANDRRDKVDAIVVLDPHALEELGEQSDEDSYQGADIYGIGSSVKAVVLLDNGNIQGLVVPDAYEIGYKSVGEMAQRLEHRFYRLKGHKTEIKVFDRDEFSLNDNMERFLYSYE